MLILCGSIERTVAHRMCAKAPTGVAFTPRDHSRYGRGGARLVES